MTPPQVEYRIIPLNKGQVAFVSPRLYRELAQFNWFAVWDKLGKCFYACRNLKVDEKWTMISMHRQIMGLGHGDARQVDHKNGNRLDNTDLNLRIATHQENMRNQKMHRDNASGFKGVTWQFDKGKWRARIVVNRKPIHLGYYETAEEGHEAYCRAARELFGEFWREE